ncbi:MAG: PH domain-containing protein [Candidatus Micrarchaeota archaeon]
MAKKPSWRVIIFWMKRPLYVAIVFGTMFVIIVLIDKYTDMWQGVTSGYVNGFGMVAPLFAVILLPSLIWNALKWYTTSHSISEKQLIFIAGVLNKKKYVVNYEQIQNINIVRTFLERLLMISTIKIETAGSKPGESELEIEGIDSNDGERLVVEISHLVEETKTGKRSDISAGNGGTGLKELMDYSKRILLELSEIKDLLAEDKKKNG